MQTLTISHNFSSTRRVTFNGREHIVAPLTMIVPGVLAGSQGPLYYPEDEVQKNVGMWNGMPIVVNHPKKDGTPISARTEVALNEFGVGTILNARFEDGKLKADGYFDVERLTQVDNRLLMSLNSEQPMELSTGLFTDNESKAGEFNGTQYKAIARNYIRRS